MTREDAYKIVQDLTMRVWKREGNLKELSLEDPVVASKTGKDEINDLFNLNRYYKNIDAIYRKAEITEA